MLPVTLARQRGLTLVELMVSLVISSLIVIAASWFYLGSVRTRDMQDAASVLQENARFLTDVLTRNIQQAGYQNYILSDPSGLNKGSELRRENSPGAATDTPDISGFNNSGMKTGSNQGTHNYATERVNNSDVLVIRYQGMGTAAGAADGSIVNCLGKPEAPPLATDALTDRPYSVFALGPGSSTGGEPEMLCKYYDRSGSTYQFSNRLPIARGVEYFQVMFGVDTNNDQLVDKWMNAQEVDTATAWVGVRSVRVGLVLRSPNRVNEAQPAGTVLYPLGNLFTEAAGTDAGGSFTIPDDGRLRRVVSFTVNLRNDLRWNYQSSEI